MKTDELIALMAANAAPVAPGAARRRLLAACLIGAACAAAIMFAARGPWPDLARAVRTGPFWMKAGYTFWLGVGGFLLADRAARPGARVSGGVYVVGAALLAIAMLAALNLAFLSPDRWSEAWMGVSALFCPFAIVVSATPVFIAMVLVLRGMAPTRLGPAGAAAGLLAGAVGAMVYALWCREQAAIFVATWYTLGIAASAGVGGLLGPRILRW